MLIDAGFPKAWWGYEIISSSTIRNLCTKSSFKSKDTPFERFYIRDADLNIFRPFRCESMIYIPLESSTKLYNTAKNGSFVGVAEGSLSLRTVLRLQKTSYKFEALHLLMSRCTGFLNDFKKNV